LFIAFDFADESFDDFAFTTGAGFLICFFGFGAGFTSSILSTISSLLYLLAWVCYSSCYNA